MSTFLEVGLAAVREAEKVIMQYYRGEIVVEYKVDESPVTAADKEAEAAIRRVILEAFPDHVVYGEEGAKQAGRSDQYTWVVDPIDGTKSFIRKHGMFGTLLALFHEDEVILGISNMPAMGEMLYAEKGKGAFLNGERVHVSGVDTLHDAFVTFGSIKYFKQSNNQEVLLSLGEQVKWARGMGDCWSYHLLARGGVDIVVEGNTKIWDVAPFKIIVEEAGGRMTTLKGDAVGFNLSDNVATNGLLHDEVVDRFSKAGR